MFEPYLLRFTFNNCYYEKIGNNNPIKLDDLPFDISDNWIWIRQKNICWLDNGVKAKGEKLPYLEAKVIRGKQSPSMVESGVIVDSNNKVILVDGENSGEIMTPPYKGYMGSTFKIFSATPLFNYSYLIEIFKLNKEKYKNSKVGAAIPHLNKELFKESLIAVPPFDEQQRIVKKINFFEQLIKEYDHNEKQLTELESSFADKLKKSILQYAIEGKLVKQDPNDEPASVLLERIKNEKEQLIKEGKIKRDKNESYIFQGDDKNYYENLPDKWALTQVKNVCLFIKRGKSPNYSNEKEIPILAQKCNQWDRVHLEKCLFTKRENLSKYSWDRISCAGDVIINSTGGGTVGRTNILPDYIFESYPVILPDSHISTLRPSKEINPKYLYFYFLNPFFQNHVEEMCEGSTNQIELYAKTIGSLLIPLPPKKAQDKIVDRILNLFEKI